MEKRGWLVSCTLICMYAALLMLPAAAACFHSAWAAEKVTLRFLYQQPRTDRGLSLFSQWQDKVNAIAPERLHLRYMGANEVIPSFEQLAALKRGTVDMAVQAPVFFTGAVPEGMAIQCVGAKLPVPEVRKRGMVALMDQIYRAKAGVSLLGGLWSGDHHMVLLKKPVSKATLSGLKIRTVPVHNPAVKLLEGTITTIPPEETYTALQTGLLDGAATPCVMAPDYRFEEVTSYIFFPLIPMSSWAQVLVKADVWDKLPADVKQIMTTSMIEMESKVDPYFEEMEKRILDDFQKKGLKKCGAATPSENDEITKKMIKVQWKAFVEERADPAWLPKLNQMAKPILGID